MTISRLLCENPVWDIGTMSVGGERTAWQLSEPTLARHTAVFGGSRSGKSKFLELLCRRLMDDFRGFCFVDPHGDTVEDLLAYASVYCEKYQSDAICKRIHYLEPSFETVFGFDPFEFRLPDGIAEASREAAYHQWLHAKATSIANLVQRKQGQSGFESMPRLERILRDVLVAVGTPVDKSGKHLPLSDALVLLDHFHPRHRQVLELILPHLPSDVRGDFNAIASYRSEEQRKKETESTINRLRSLFSPIVKSIFDCGKQSIDFRRIMTNRGIILVNLRRTAFFSADQRKAIGGLLINEILESAELTQRELRKQYYLLVDEARLMIGEDLMEALDQAAKFKLSVILAGQYLGQFKTETLDMRPSILNNCGNVVSFQQKDPEDLDVWKRFFAYPGLNFEKYVQAVDRHEGYEFITLQDTSESSQTSESKSLTFSDSTSEGINRSVSRSISHQKGEAYQHGLSKTESESRGESAGISDAKGGSKTENENFRRIPDERGLMYPARYEDHSTKSETKGRTITESGQKSKSESESEGENWSHSQQQSSSETKGQSVGATRSVTKGEAHGSTTSESTGKSVTQKTIPLAKIVRSYEETPQLKTSVEDQFHRVAAIQSSLPQRHALARMSDSMQSCLIEVGNVQEVYPDPAYYRDAINRMKRALCKVHPYLGSPGLSPEEEDRRLREFVAAIPDPQPPHAAEKPSETKPSDHGFLA